MNLRTFLLTSVGLTAAALPGVAAAEDLGAVEAQAPAIVVNAANSAESDLGAIAPKADAMSEKHDYIAALPGVETAPLGVEPSARTFDLASQAASTAEMAANSVVAVAQYSGSAAGAEAREDSYTVLLNQDSFFGFYPSFNGLIPISDNVDFSFYGIFWTTDGFGTGLGSDLWTEFGAGVAIHTMDDNLVIKPQIGITNGALLSGGVRDDTTDLPTGTGGNFLDGIVPSLTMNYSDDSFEAEYYGGYYAAVRNRNDPGANDFLHTWINAGGKISDKFSAGAHYELLSLTRTKGGNSAVVYQWVGPYVQFSTDNGFFARFTAGADVEDGNDGDFYKLTAGFSF
jgi:hypothetical protein